MNCRTELFNLLPENLDDFCFVLGFWIATFSFVGFLTSVPGNKVSSSFSTNLVAFSVFCTVLQSFLTTPLAACGNLKLGVTKGVRKKI